MGIFNFVIFKACMNQRSHHTGIKDIDLCYTQNLSHGFQIEYKICPRNFTKQVWKKGGEINNAIKSYHVSIPIDEQGELYYKFLLSPFQLKHDIHNQLKLGKKKKFHCNSKEIPANNNL